MPLPFSLQLLTAHSCLPLLYEAAERGEESLVFIVNKKEREKKQANSRSPTLYTFALKPIPNLLLILPSIVVLYTRSCGVVQEKNEPLLHNNKKK